MVKDVPMPPNKDRYNDVYIVYELMDTDLHQIIRSSQTLTNEHYQVSEKRDRTYHCFALTPPLPSSPLPSTQYFIYQ